MTLYVSRYTGYHIGIQQGKWRTIEVDGDMTRAVRKAEFVAHFTGKILPEAARREALEHFDARNGQSNGEPPGPIRNDGVSMDEEFFGFAYEGSGHYLNFTAFDTETDITEEDFEAGEEQTPSLDRDEVRALFEKKLDAAGDRGDSYIRIEKVRLAPPWPRYDEIVTSSGVGKESVVKRLRDMIEGAGLDVAYCEAYEKENRNRDYVLFEYGQMAEAAELKHAEDEALTA